MNPLTMLGFFGDDPSTPASADAPSQKPKDPMGAWLQGLPKAATIGGLQAASSYASTLANIGQIRRNATEQATSALEQATDAGINANQAFVEGQGKVATLREQLAQSLSARQSLAAASGVDVGQGTIATQRSQITDSADTAATINQVNAAQLAARYRSQQFQDIFRAQNTLQNADQTVAADRKASILNMLASAGRILLPA
jgi:hypothetical protein